LRNSALNSRPSTPPLAVLTAEWGSKDSIALYLDRCQVDTPLPVVDEVWKQILGRRKKIERVIDYGAGDGRFAQYGSYGSYLGYEIDASRQVPAGLPKHAELVTECAFESRLLSADLVIGNPPYVRNQDLPLGWRQKASALLYERSGLAISGLANAWQYFFLLSLLTTSSKGLCALVIPYEWVSRPSAKAIRDYIVSNGWEVSVYRLLDSTFHRVLTTSSITIVDKRSSKGTWSYFEQQQDGRFLKLSSASGAAEGVLGYTRRKTRKIVAKRGLSPGTQKIFTLTESERARLGLRRGVDVVPCVTSLKAIKGESVLTGEVFTERFVNAGEKCWLIKTTGQLSPYLRAYIDKVPGSEVATATCLARENWWTFAMPSEPQLFVATGFTGDRPKSVVNKCGAVAVGGVAGIYGVSKKNVAPILAALQQLELNTRVVAHANGLKKLEINQLNTLLDEIADNA
jgi:hypothetical protein